MASGYLALMLGLDAALAVTLTLVSTALMPITLPLVGLYLLGVDIDVPLANLMVDRLQAAGLLSRGAAYWYGRALRLGARSPLEAVELLTTTSPDKLQPLSAEDEGRLRDEVRSETRAAVDELRSRVAARDALRNELGMSPAPHKYVIVATGNIYDDVFGEGGGGGFLRRGCCFGEEFLLFQPFEPS